MGVNNFISFSSFTNTSTTAISSVDPRTMNASRSCLSIQPLFSCSTESGERQTRAQAAEDTNGDSVDGVLVGDGGGDAAHEVDIAAEVYVDAAWLGDRHTTDVGEACTTDAERGAEHGDADDDSDD